MHASRTMLVAFAILLGGCASIPSAVSSKGDIRIDHMVIPAAAEAGSDIAAYAGFENAGADDKLVAIHCACAERVELHRVIRDAGGGRMESDFPLPLPAGARVEVKPPGVPLHFMLIKTNRAFVAGERVPLRLRFERAGEIEAVFTVATTSKDGWERWTQP